MGNGGITNSAYEVSYSNIAFGLIFVFLRGLVTAIKCC